MDPVAPTKVASASSRVAGIAADVLHDMDGHSYWAHDVHGPAALEHDVAHAPDTDLRDKPELM